SGPALSHSQSTKTPPSSRYSPPLTDAKPTTAARRSTPPSSSLTQSWSMDDFSIFESKPPAAARANSRPPPVAPPPVPDLHGIAASSSLRQAPAAQVPKSPITAVPRTREDIQAESDAVVNKIVANLPDLSYMMH